MTKYAAARLLWLADTQGAAHKWRRLLRHHQTHIEPVSGGKWACYSLVSDWFLEAASAAAKVTDLAGWNPGWSLFVVAAVAPKVAA